MFVNLLIFSLFGTLQCQLARKTPSACTLDPHPSLEYHCSTPGVPETRNCLSKEPDGTIVHPRCHEPYYYSPVELNPMWCNDGLWDNVASGADCKLDCGKVVERKWVSGGRPPEKNESLPWHASFFKTTKSKGISKLKYHCGGSLISYNRVLSAARCFWSRKLMKNLKPSIFVVEVGEERGRQKSNVKEIIRYPSVPSIDFQRDDIVIVILTETLKYSFHVRPVCLSFNTYFEEEQMKPGIKGKFTNRGETRFSRDTVSLLQVLEIPYVGYYPDCNGTNYLPPLDNINRYHKFCAGSKKDEIKVCETNAGTGVAFPHSEIGIERYYLRGIVSMDRLNRKGMTTELSGLDPECILKVAIIILFRYNWTQSIPCDYLTFVSLEYVQQYKDFINSNWNQGVEPFELFNCLDGSNVLNNNKCDGVQNCADGSDEEGNLCGYTQTSTVVASNPTTTLQGKCVLPPYPEFGSYVTNIPDAGPGNAYDLVTLNITCHRGHGLLGSSSLHCLDGFWTEPFPKCIRMCQLLPHPSVEYRCVESGVIEGLRACRSYEPAGTIVSPKCREPNYYSTNSLSFMRCSDEGYWDYTARCSPECGRVSPDGVGLTVGGYTARKGEFPWHAGIYKKAWNPYMQVCGGSIISSNVIISAAHCFWTSKPVPAAQFAVAVGKLYRPWDNTKDDAQKSDVREIHMPDRFQGAEANFQDDIAIVIVTDPFEYKNYIRPVCLSFDVKFERQQLRANNMGKVPGWGLTSENGNPSPTLQVVELPFVDITTCIDDYPAAFREYITSDKICAGTLKPNSALCRGDSGGGLVFPALDQFTERYYLRGIVSTAPNNENKCNTATYTSFTQIRKHEHFIKQFWTEL